MVKLQELPKDPGTPLGRRPRILHLGYEDPSKPGAGGGSVRTHEINRRLSGEFDITVACARFPGATSYTRDGVRYLHIGVGTGYATAVMSYFASQPGAVARRTPDLVVEDFGAPLSTWGLPRVTRRPVVGVVQWLFAEEKARQYHLPFGAIESVGVRAHRTLVAVSDDLGARLSTRAPQATVHVIPNGIQQDAFELPASGPRRDIAYLGRLEDAQKGVSLLLRAFATSAKSGINQDLILAGAGPDENRLRDLSAELGISHRTHFVGHIPLAERLAWLSRAQFVVMPSRYETFGMVAAESMAVGTPVVAFDIPCLRSLIVDGTGRRVPPFDVPALAAAITELAGAPRLRDELSAAARVSVRGLTWESAANQQGRLYRDVLAV